MLELVTLGRLEYTADSSREEFPYLGSAGEIVGLTKKLLGCLRFFRLFLDPFPLRFV